MLSKQNLNFLPGGAPPPGSPDTRLGRPLKKRTGLGSPLKTCIFQTWPQNLYNQAAQVESFNFIPISSKMVQVMMVYERPENLLNLAPCFIVKMSVSGIRFMRGPMVFTKILCAARWFLFFIMRDCSLLSFCHKLSLATISKTHPQKNT